MFFLVQLLITIGSLAICWKLWKFWYPILNHYIFRHFKNTPPNFKPGGENLQEFFKGYRD